LAFENGVLAFENRPVLAFEKGVLEIFYFTQARIRPSDQGLQLSLAHTMRF
jgi:hypothetical protein